MNNSASDARLARNLVHCCRDAALATLGPSGNPHASHVAVATLIDGSPVMLVSNLAVHTRNMARDRRASLLFVASDRGGDTNTRARVTVSGTLEPVNDAEVAKGRFLRRHPDAGLYADFADFSFWRLVPESAHLVAGFGRISDLTAGDLLAPGAEALVAMDPGACRHMNEDHLDALKLIAEVLGEAPEGDWHAVAIDPLGIDMVCAAGAGEIASRVEYDAPTTDGTGVRMALVALTKRARAMREAAAAAP
ncbi:HugZ family protein [Acuticoccus sp. I52.16.1]|uniref:HugZ family pyridoxamine 5'-phosphate oxidase n=1 Tax=Acuticoccus sp. I52.16.1 TaxID=2928472 RepID=UPI001FD03A28|nr:DUF2470 domain-containing protein [Acuticoccus sp. I52.16.1]UOM32887.1 pyridoxamine 5'-phosphate oxidase family protein [Acuticoccus sp. I52.16.1]